jgi:outer membrane receptor protein involved in Fe transport
MKRTLIIVLISISFSIQAQKSSKNGSLSGIVVDSVSQKPVEFSSVSIIDPLTNKPVNGAMCDTDGKFSVTQLDKGNFQVVISFVGYASKKFIVALTDKINQLKLGSIALRPIVKLLREVTVEGQKELVEERVDRTIYNAEQDATTKGGDATDVLKRVPMLSVDADGNVSLRGSQNIKVLINNKPSTISANSVADALKQIPADMVKTVEVITSPSSKYDAEGSGGIINIVLKKNTLEGMFLSTDVTVGSRGSNAGINTSYRKGKMGFTVGSFLRETYNIVSDYSNQQTTFVRDTITYNTQQARNQNDGTTGTYNLGWDYDINKNNSLTANARVGYQNQNSYQDQLSTTTYGQYINTSQTLRNVKSTNVGENYDASLTYTKKFEKKEREFNFLGIISKNNQTNGYVINTLQPTDNSILSRNKNDNPGSTQEMIFQADYQEPIKEGQLLEFGAKTTIRKVISDYTYSIATGDVGAYTIDPTRKPNGFNYNTAISGAYIAYTVEMNAYTLKAGGRYEYTDINAHFNSQPDISIPSYGTLVPSINLSRKLDNGKMIKASYTRRIQRPNLRDLNPNVQGSNSKSVSVGNPYLKPEYADTYDLSYKTNIKNVTLNISTYVRYNSNDIQSARIVRHDTIFAIAQNIGTEENYGASIFASVPVTDKFTLNGGTDIFYRILRNNVTDPLLNATNSGITPNFRVFGTYNFNKLWSVQFFTALQGKNYNLQGYRTNPVSHSVSVKKNIWGKNGSLTLGLDNFATPSYQIHSVLNSAYLNQTTTNTLMNFIIKASLSYKIGRIIESMKKNLVEED